MMEKIKVLVADDHPVFREGLVSLLTQEEDIEVIAQASDGIEAVQLVHQLSPDVAIIDMSMPELNGIETTKKIKTASPSTAILVLTAYDYDAYVLGAIEAGASGYLLKDIRIWELVGAIRSLHAGETVLDPTAAYKVFSRLAYSEGGATETSRELHQRELDVLKLAAKGMSNKEIASELSISIQTVASYFNAIFRKLNVDSRTQAVIHGLKKGLFTLDDL